VAVKNIAEKLLAYGFLNWKLIVSRDFHFGWHEHLYTKISDNVIQSDELTQNGFSAIKVLKGCKVMLCTLSMLSSPLLKIAGIIRNVPLHTLVVDEASQIEVGYIRTTKYF